MPSPEASRRNSRKSTGPRTPEGKAAVRLNSLSHGAFAADLLLPGEDTEAFHRLESGYINHFQPSTDHEEALVNRLILASWRLLRLAAMETRVLRTQAAMSRDNAEFVQSLRALVWDKDEDPDREPEETEEPEEPKAEVDVIAGAWLRDAGGANAVVKLVRYQNALERSFYRALHELERLRQGAEHAPPSP